MNKRIIIFSRPSPWMRDLGEALELEGFRLQTFSDANSLENALRLLSGTPLLVIFRLEGKASDRFFRRLVAENRDQDWDWVAVNAFGTRSLHGFLSGSRVSGLLNFGCPLPVAIHTVNEVAFKGRAKEKRSIFNAKGRLMASGREFECEVINISDAGCCVAIKTSNEEKIIRGETCRLQLVNGQDFFEISCRIKNTRRNEITFGDFLVVGLELDGNLHGRLQERILSGLKKHKKIVYVVTGSVEVGLGHVYRALTIVPDLTRHRIVFLADKTSRMAFDKLTECGLEAYLQESTDIVDDIKRISPDVVINDVLDTSAEYVAQLKASGMKVINFEDRGSGIALADMVINDLYSGDNSERMVFGAHYFCASDEFIDCRVAKVKNKVSKVLITFGSTDPCNLTCKTLEAIYPLCIERGISLDVIIGFGYQHASMLERFPAARVSKNVPSMADFMLQADLIFSSAGRTLYEIACVGTPAIVMSQNEREMTHSLVANDNVCLNLGLGSSVTAASIATAFLELADDKKKRLEMQKKILTINPKFGRFRVIDLIYAVTEQEPWLSDADNQWKAG